MPTPNSANAICSTAPEPERPTVLVVDDDPPVARAVARALDPTRYRTLIARHGAEALEVFGRQRVDVLLCDVVMPELSGRDVLRRVKASWPDCEVVLMTAHASVESAVEAMREGAHDFLTKPFVEPDQVTRAVDRALKHAALARRNRELETRLGMDDTQDAFDMVGRSPAMEELYRQIRAVQVAHVNVLIAGESGTGKELVARALHRGSPRSRARFVPVNCSALTATLLESELFGHVRGAFTGASSAKEGLFERAHGGTLFLDEIGDMPPELQVKLLRVLQEGEVRRVGATEARKVDVRVVSATHVDLKRAMQEGRFREDLFYRLNVIALTTPPLRSRADDVPLLAHTFLRRASARHGKHLQGYEPQALQRLVTYRWPGNVRELENVVERAVVLAGGSVVRVEDLPHELGDHAAKGDVAPAKLTRLEFRSAKELAVRQFERRYLEEALAQTGQNVTQAARVAGLDRSNFRRLLRKHTL